MNIEAEKPGTEDEKNMEVKERRNEETKKPKEATRKGSNKKDEETNNKGRKRGRDQKGANEAIF